MATRPVIFYVQFMAERARPDGSVRDIKAARITQTRPESPIPGSVVAKLEVEVPVEAFEPLEVTGELGIDHALRVPVVSRPVEEVEDVARADEG